MFTFHYHAREISLVRPMIEALEKRCLLSSVSGDDVELMTVLTGAGALHQRDRDESGVEAAPTSFPGTAYDTTVQPDGKLIVAGTFNGDFGLARYNADGSLDPTFGVNGITTTMFGSPADVAYGVRVGADGRIVAVGVTNAGTDQWKFALAGYTPEGGTDFFFGDSGRLHTGIGKGSRAGGYLAVREDGTISVLGWDGGDAFAARRFNAAGRNPTDPLAGQSSSDSSTGAESSSASYGVGAPGVSGSGSVNEGSQYSVTLPSVPAREISWGDGTIETIPDEQPDAQHTYADGPNTYNVFASTHPGAITVGSGGLRTFTDDIGTVITDSVSLTEDGSGNPTAELDLNTNDLVVDYAAAGPSPYAALRRWAYYGYNSGGANGITSSAGHGDRILAVVDNAEWNQNAFNGRPVDSSTVIGKYTYFGDADMNGRVTSDDYVAVDVNLGGTNKQWFHGDFSGDGNVTSDEYVAIDANLGKSLPPPHEVTVNNVAPIPKINGTPMTAPPGSPINLIGTVSDPGSVDNSIGFTYSWSVTKDGEPFSTGTPTNGDVFTFTPDTEGIYEVTLDVADNDGGTGTDRDTITVVASPAPDPPSGLIVTAYNWFELELSWNDATDNITAYYNIYRSTDPDFAPTPATLLEAQWPETAWADDTCEPSTRYYYVVTAVDEFGVESAPVARMYGQTPSGGPSGAGGASAAAAPSEAPSDLTASPICDDDVYLSWKDNSKSETAFEIQVSEGFGGAWRFHSFAPKNSRNWEVGDLNSSTFYTFRVSAIIDGSPTAQSNEASTSTHALGDFDHVIIGLAGHDERPHTQSKKHKVGVAAMVQSLQEQGYHAHVYAENGDTKGVLDENGSGAALDEINRLIDAGLRTLKVGIIGYSHGGGQTYHLAERLVQDRRDDPVRFDRTVFTGYIDAITRGDSDLTFLPERRFPPGTMRHLNFYQRAFGGFGFPWNPLHGNSTIDDPPAEMTSFTNDEITRSDVNGAAVNHFTVDDFNYVRSRMLQAVKDQIDLTI